eukprot:Protomagalhaensia_wolfi_Nauph_80__5800@NODE_720_length_2069_cov_136_277340_g122_i1_p1_GENE_NODE_720_length_2069_cov_136_277340_g122_i1NODE_720_length_2069_cov_136_277340_g122_i1_p1_ORF_typecomplete_len611_score164_16GST_N/PF02798_20/1_4e07GST_N/PF02798_20/2e03GST_N/PF02798_20/6_1e08GST_C_3/PF14497_6/6_2e06GST_C_3/PF14497_6/4_9e06GST_N_3/PF13417_6/0_011GST_N_3/PF13417_6/6_1e03GST_N_3/PF13417_6/0_00018GST_C_5/PF16865_5/6_8e05GST_C_5/PF16865_5/6_3e03GST_N_4/PF17172_4/0_041GST_N_4/PF17172_4/6_3e03GS
MSNPTLWYFDGTGLAEPARLCFVLGDVSFTDQRLRHEEWCDVWKPKFVTGKLPCLEVGGSQYPESRAILQYAASKSGLMPQKSEDRIEAQMLVSAVYDLFPAMATVIHKIKRSPPQTPTEADVTTLQARVGMVEKLVAQHQSGSDSGFCLGNKLSYVDVLMACSFENASLYLDQWIDTDSLPAMKRCHDVVFSHEKVRLWRRNHQKPKLVAGDKVRTKIAVNLLRYAKVDFEYLAAHSPPADTPADLANSFPQPWLQIGEGEEAFRVIGVHALITWVNERMSSASDRQPLVGGKAEAASRVWGLVDLALEAWDLVSRHSDPATTAPMDVVLNAFIKLNVLVLQERKPSGTFSTKFSAAELTLSALFETISNCRGARACAVMAASKLQGLRDAHHMVMARLPPMMPFNATPKLYYYDWPGKAEAIRLAFHLAGIKFDDIRLKDEEVPAMKERSPNKLVPFMEIGPTLYCESTAMLKMVAEWAGMVPATAQSRYEADMLVSAYQDFEHAIKHHYRTGETSPIAETLRPLYTQIEALLKSVVSNRDPTKGIFEGNLTYAEAYVAAEHLTARELKAVTDENEDQWPTIKAVSQAILEHPRVKAYLLSLGTATAW